MVVGMQWLVMFIQDLYFVGGFGQFGYVGIQVVYVWVQGWCVVFGFFVCYVVLVVMIFLQLFVLDVVEVQVVVVIVVFEYGWVD